VFQEISVRWSMATSLFRLRGGGFGSPRDWRWRLKKDTQYFDPAAIAAHRSAT
jgi:hypothetical protein